MKYSSLLAGAFLVSVVRLSALEIEVPNVASFTIPQETPSTCWAACNRMILKSQGVDVTEADQLMALMKKTGMDGSKGVGATFQFSKQALAGVYSKADGKTITVLPYEFYGAIPDPTRNPYQEILESLKAGIPLVVTDGQHGYVLYGATYEMINGNPVFSSIKVINPLFKIEHIPPHEVYTGTRGKYGPWLGHMGVKVAK